MFFNEYPYTNLTDLNLDYLLKNYKKLFDTLGQIDGWIENHEKEYNELKKAIDDLENGNWSPEFINALNEYYNDNLIDIIGDLIKNVYFGLTNDGYFCAFIPKHWDWVTFDTITDPDEPLYGHLVLAYD